MENCTLHILYSFDAKICFMENGLEIFSVNTLNSLSDEIDLSVENLSNFEINVYPIVNKKNSNLVPYSANITNYNNNLICDSKQVVIYRLPKNHFILKLKQLSLKSSAFDDFDKVEVKDNKIKTLKIIPTLAKNGKVEVFEINGDTPKLTENYYVKLKSENYLTNLNCLKLLHFFECLQCLDYDKAREALSFSLAEKLNKQTLSNFFGEFTEVYLVNFYEDFSVVILNEKKQTARVFGANFSANEIENIYEIE